MIIAVRGHLWSRWRCQPKNKRASPCAPGALKRWFRIRVLKNNQQMKIPGVRPQCRPQQMLRSIIYSNRMSMRR